MAVKRFRTIADITGGNDGASSGGTPDDSGSGTIGDGRPGDERTILNPAELGTGDASGISGTEGTGKKPRKPRTPKAAKASALGVTDVKNGLIITHMLAASVMGASELALTNEQADAYAVAAQGVLAHYDVGATAKTIAWVNLIGTMVTVYGTKLSEVARRKAAEKAARVKAAGANAANAFVPRAAMGVL